MGIQTLSFRRRFKLRITSEICPLRYKQRTRGKAQKPKHRPVFYEVKKHFYDRLSIITHAGNFAEVFQRRLRSVVFQESGMYSEQEEFKATIETTLHLSKEAARDEIMKSKVIRKKERQKWNTARGRFQMLFKKYKLQKLWPRVLEICHRKKYRKQYFKVKCCGKYFEDSLEIKHQGKCGASIDFLLCAPVERIQWTLDHYIEVQTFIPALLEEFTNAKEISRSRLEFFVHLMFSLEEDEKYGKPNLRPRCKACDKTDKRNFQLPFNNYLKSQTPIA
eukprot:maker-scaffold_10-snap-gene-10.42-mRNA-1 protein AED:0.05 eAED:0.05 QI:0/0.5/0.33/1/1/1/3/196/276